MGGVENPQRDRSSVRVPPPANERPPRPSRRPISRGRRPRPRRYAPPKAGGDRLFLSRDFASTPLATASRASWGSGRRLRAVRRNGTALSYYLSSRLPTAPSQALSGRAGREFRREIDAHIEPVDGDEHLLRVRS